MRGLPSPKITDVRAIATAPAGLRLVVVKVTTDQDGLYGYGCATFTQRADLVPPGGRPLPEAVPGRQARGPDRGHLAGALRELVLAERPRAQQRDQRRRHGALGHQGPPGRDARVPAPRRQGPRGGRLLRARERLRDPGGARQRPRAHGPRLPPRARPGGRPRHGRLRLAARGGAGHGAALRPGLRARGLHAPRARSSSRRRARSSATRSSSSTTSTSASPPPRPSRFCKDVERFRLFFLEDPLSPEDIAWFRLIRQQCATPIAMGELFNSPHEWTPAHRRAAHRLHPRPRLAGGRPHALPQDGGARRALRREDRVARAGRRLAGGPRLQHRPRPRLRQLRHPGVVTLRRRDARGLLGLPGAEGRLLLRERGARLGHRGRRARGGEVPVRPRRDRRAAAAERRLGRDPPARRHGHQAVAGPRRPSCAALAWRYCSTHSRRSRAPRDSASADPRDELTPWTLAGEILDALLRERAEMALRHLVGAAVARQHLEHLAVALERPRSLAACSDTSARLSHVFAESG